MRIVSYSAMRIVSYSAMRIVSYSAMRIVSYSAMRIVSREATIFVWLSNVYAYLLQSPTPVPRVAGTLGTHEGKEVCDVPVRQHCQWLAEHTSASVQQVPRRRPVAGGRAFLPPPPPVPPLFPPSVSPPVRVGPGLPREFIRSCLWFLWGAGGALSGVISQSDTRLDGAGGGED